MIRKLGVLFSALLFGGQLILASTQDGTSTAQFLRLGQGARAEGMGGAFTAVADDVFSISFNPAGLAQVTKVQLAANYMSFIEDIDTQFGALSIPFNSVNGTMGLGFHYYDFGTIERRDASGAPQAGETDLSAYSASLSWGQALGDSLALGVTGRVFREDLAEYSETGFSGDLGGFWYLIPNRFSLGAAILNVGPDIKIGTTDESLPMTVRVGGAYRPIPDKLTLSLDVEKERDTDSIYHGGAEYTYKTFFFRGGYHNNFGPGGGWSAGAGFIWIPGSLTQNFFDRKDNLHDGNSLRIDYSYVDYGDFDATHRVGVLYSF